MTDDDPLDGAAVGETRVVTWEEEFWLWDTAHGTHVTGWDRSVGDVTADAEIVGEPGAERVHITYEGEVVKTLPRRWHETDYSAATESTEVQSSSDNSPSAVVRHALTGGLVAAIAVIAVKVTNAVSAELTVTGEAVGPVPLAPTLGGIGLLALGLTLMWAATGGLPPMRRYT